MKVLGERTRAQRDAELRRDAFDLSSISSSVTSGSSLTPTVKQCDTGSPVLFTTSTVPDALKTSPSYAVIGQVLRAPIDFTTKDWQIRNFYDQSSVVAYARWSQPEGQPHRDASDALAALSDPEVLAVPADLRHSNPEVFASAWDQYRRHLIHSLHTAAADSYQIAIFDRRGLSELSGSYRSYLVAISADSCSYLLIAADSYQR